MVVKLSTSKSFNSHLMIWYVCSEGAVSATRSSPSSSDTWRQLGRGTSDRNADWRDHTGNL